MTRLEARPGTRHGRRALSRPLGVVLLAVGLVLLGHLAWQLLGTNYVGHRHQHQVMRELGQAWQRDTPRVATEFGTAEAIVEVPRFGAGYRMPVLEGVSPTVLASGFGHFPGTALAGAVGNYALAAHRVTHGEPLRRMPKLRAGDEVRVLTRDATFVYRLMSAGDALVVPMTQTWVVDAVPHNPAGGVQPPQRPGQRLLTLTTCAEVFHTSRRMVAFGILVRTEPR